MSFYTLGKTYKELTVGDFAVQSKTISESDVYSFAGITGDLNPLHVDKVFVELMGFDKRVAHAGLAPALISQVIGMKLPGLGAMIESMDVSFHLPIFIGDTIVACATIIEKKADALNIVMSLEWKNQQQVIVSSGFAIVSPPKSELNRLLDGKKTNEVTTRVNKVNS
jgi:3-hydroxybutyryl-CoA dehydratase